MRRLCGCLLTTAKAGNYAGQWLVLPRSCNVVCPLTKKTGLHYQTYTAKAVACDACALGKQCLKGLLKPNDGRGRQVTRFEPKAKDPGNPSERMRRAIDYPGVGSYIASALALWSQCLPTSGTTSV